ncbi:hypothetical protein TeGR_g14202, partial [Tetraparma gracilis]
LAPLAPATLLAPACFLAHSLGVRRVFIANNLPGTPGRVPQLPGQLVGPRLAKYIKASLAATAASAALHYL